MTTTRRRHTTRFSRLGDRMTHPVVTYRVGDPRPSFPQPTTHRTTTPKEIQS